MPRPDQQAEIVVLCQGTKADGTPYWAYLQMNPVKAKAFKLAQATGAFSLQDYGEIVQWGEGAEVPPDVMAYMEQEHGVNHAFQDELMAGCYKK